MFRWLRQYQYNLAYGIFIILLNTLFSWVPLINVFGSEISPLDFTVGSIYVLRDLAQRELGHKVIFSMLLGGAISYFLASPQVALASVSAFLIAEGIDWGVYTWTRRDLSKRILLSASLSSPIDSLVFLGILHQLNVVGFMILSAAKLLGVVLLWSCWRYRILSVRKPAMVSQ
jgi:queuosine precursor transporter